MIGICTIGSEIKGVKVGICGESGVVTRTGAVNGKGNSDSFRRFGGPIDAGLSMTPVDDLDETKAGPSTATNTEGKGGIGLDSKVDDRHEVTRVDLTGVTQGGHQQ